jgi:hypothetical protein
MIARNAYQDGYHYAKDWVGPNGDGSFGSMSLDFIDETASEWGEYSGDWWDGFWAATQRRAS